MNTPYKVSRAIRGRLGGRFDLEDTAFSAHILAEMQNAQYFLEQGPIYPAFLLAETPFSIDCSVYSGSVALPSDFIIEDEHTPPSYTTTDSKFQKLRKKPYGQIRFMTTAAASGEGPVYYCIHGDTFKWANPPTSGTIKVYYKQRQDEITGIDASDTGNKWYARAGNVIMTRAAFVLASSYLKDQELAGILNGEFAAAYRQLEALEVMRECDHMDLSSENEYGS